MNTLKEEDQKLFHKLMNLLLFYVNNKIEIIKNAKTFQDFISHDVQETIPLRNKLFSKNYNFIDNYISENPDRLNQDGLNIISSWKKYKTGSFYIVKHVKDYSLFFDSDNPKVYGVKGIFDSFEEKFEGYAPILVKITLIPFRDSLIYEGIFNTFNVGFGGGIKSSLKHDYEEAIQRFGIITSLNIDPQPIQQSDENTLRFYMKSSSNRNHYYYEIIELKNKSKELEAVYYQEESKSNAKFFKKDIKSNGIKGSFAVLGRSVIASGSNNKELNENLKKILPLEKMNWIHTFKL